MNRNGKQDPWPRLVAAARQAPDDRPVEPPYGFSTRVAAQALATGRGAASLMDRFALRALGVAAVLALASVAVNYGVVKSRSTAQPADTQTAAEDPMSALLDA